MARTAAEAPSVEEALAWEAEQRPRAGIASVAAGVLLFLTFVYGIVGFRDSPNVTLTEGFRDVVGRPVTGGAPGLLTESARWTKDNAAELIAVTLASAIGTILIAFALGYLFRATQARRPETSRFILGLVLVGPILSGIGPLISAVSAVASSSSYINGGMFSTLRAHEALREGSGFVLAAAFGTFGTLAIAGGILFLSLNAMRTGLLTRFMGVLGCIVGALLLLPPLFGPPTIVQSFFLVALGLLFLGRVRTVPPAWATGRAEPWPSQQELRERKERGEGAALRSSVAPDSEPAAVASPAAPRTPSQKRKRKRR